MLLLLLSGKTRNYSGLPEVEVIKIIELQRSILFLKRNVQVVDANNLLLSWILCQVQAEELNVTLRAVLLSLRSVIASTCVNCY